MTDISIVINCHREHLLAHPSLVSANEARLSAKDRGIVCEMLIVLDRPNEKTRDYLANHELRNNWNLHEVDVGDLGLARNHGVEMAKGQYIAFLDGDDLWGENWLHMAIAAARDYSSADTTRKVIWHPASSLVFGEGDNHYFNHRDMEDPKFDVDWLRLDNYWTSLSFAERQIYLEHPFETIDMNTGKGYEDWSWNCHTIAAGIIHKTISDTLHFVRRKKTGSLLTATKEHFALPDWGNLFFAQNTLDDTSALQK